MTELRAYPRHLARIRPHLPRTKDWDVVKRVAAEHQQYFGKREERLRAGLSDVGRLVRARRAVLDIDTVVSVFAIVKEATNRIVSLPLCDEQILAGVALAAGAIVEMRPGEDKSLAYLFPSILYGLVGRGVHVVSHTEDSAKHNFESLKPIYESLGVSVGHLQKKDALEAKRRAYECDVTYAAADALGSDFLRDELTNNRRSVSPVGQSFRNALHGIHEPSPKVQRGHAFAIIADLDGVLIDSGEHHFVIDRTRSIRTWETIAFRRANAIVDNFIHSDHYRFSPCNRRVSLTQCGARLAYSMSGVLGELPKPWRKYVEQAICAHILYQRDRHYIVRNESVTFVDSCTGEILADFAGAEGILQAIEAKEDLRLSDERCSVARISRQEFFRRYERMCGAIESSAGLHTELSSAFSLPVVSIPSRKPDRRREIRTRYFETANQKWEAITDEVQRRRQLRQTVCISVGTVASGKQLAAMLRRREIPLRLLGRWQNDLPTHSAKLDLNAVTIATNEVSCESHVGSEFKWNTGADFHLHVIATERNLSRHLDQRMTGQTARRGAPGSYQFFVSAEDAIVQEFGPAIAQEISRRKLDGQICASLDLAVSKLQRKAERHLATIRLASGSQKVWTDNTETEAA